MSSDVCASYEGCDRAAQAEAAHGRALVEIADLQAERDRLARWKAEASPMFDGLQDLGRALGLPLGAAITGPMALEAAEQLKAERDADSAARDAVESGVLAWCAINEIAEPPLDWAGLGELLARHAKDGDR